MKYCFPPVIDAKTEIIILGSFPGEASLKKSQYYGHPQNQFWRLLAVILDKPLPEMDYEKRLEILLRHHIGLWDVISCCERTGSLDSNIRNHTNNDFSILKTLAPKLRKVCFNGKTAAKYQRSFTEQGLKTLVLPSSSPAYTISFEQKLRSWRQLLS
jgi:hypoxanthine-DNA glycosylase